MDFGHFVKILTKVNFFIIYLFLSLFIVSQTTTAGPLKRASRQATTECPVSWVITEWDSPREEILSRAELLGRTMVTDDNLRAACPFKYTKTDMWNGGSKIYPRYVKETICLYNKSMNDQRLDCADVIRQIDFFEKINCTAGNPVFNPIRIPVRVGCISVRPNAMSWTQINN